MKRTTWYVIHVFSGYEQKIERQIRYIMENNESFARVCRDIKVPMYEKSDVKTDGKVKLTKKKLMPGYILVDLDLPDADEDEDKYKEIVAIFKSINGVTGFLGGTTVRNARPIPLTEAEYTKILEQIGEIKVEKPIYAMMDYKEGDLVRIISGSFSGFKGKISEILPGHSKLKILVEIFGRLTSVEVESSDVEKIK